MTSRFFPQTKRLAIAGLVCSLTTIALGIGFVIPKYGQAGAIFTASAGLFAIYYLCGLLTLQKAEKIK